MLGIKRLFANFYFGCQKPALRQQLVCAYCVEKLAFVLAVPPSDFSFQSIF